MATVMASKMTDREKLVSIRTKVEDLLRDRMTQLCSEAFTISSDMDALCLRLSKDGSLAGIEDIRSARWYRTAGDFRILQEIYQHLETVRCPPDDVSFKVKLPDDDNDTDPDEADRVEPE